MNIVIIGIGSVAMSISSIINSESNYKITVILELQMKTKNFVVKKFFKNYPFLGTEKF